MAFIFFEATFILFVAVLIIGHSLAVTLAALVATGVSEPAALAVFFTAIPVEFPVLIGTLFFDCAASKKERACTLEFAVFVVLTLIPQSPVLTEFFADGVPAFVKLALEFQHIVRIVAVPQPMILPTFHSALVDALPLLVILHAGLTLKHVVEKWTLVFFIPIPMEVDTITLPTALLKITLISQRPVHTELFTARPGHLPVQENSNKLNHLKIFLFRFKLIMKL
jgi:hypothetical protein